MIDTDTFLTTLYVMVDDFCKVRFAMCRRPGPVASLSRGEVVTLAVFGRWARFQSERDFYRYACRRLRSSFPTLPLEDGQSTAETSPWRDCGIFSSSRGTDASQPEPT